MLLGQSPRRDNTSVHVLPEFTLEVQRRRNLRVWPIKSNLAQNWGAKSLTKTGPVIAATALTVESPNGLQQDLID
jgi:hypothetical protein